MLSSLCIAGKLECTFKKRQTLVYTHEEEKNGRLSTTADGLIKNEFSVQGAHCVMKKLKTSY